MNETATHRHPVSLRLTDDAVRLLGDLANSLGVSKSAVIEMAIREKARREFQDDAWAYTPEMRASIARARQQPGYAVTPAEMEELAVAADAGDPALVIERIIAKHRDD